MDEKMRDTDEMLRNALNKLEKLIERLPNGEDVPVERSAVAPTAELLMLLLPLDVAVARDRVSKVQVSASHLAVAKMVMSNMEQIEKILVMAPVLSALEGEADKDVDDLAEYLTKCFTISWLLSWRDMLTSRNRHAGELYEIDSLIRVVARSWGVAQEDLTNLGVE